MSDRPAIAPQDRVNRPEGEAVRAPEGDSDPADHRLRLDWTRLNGASQPAGSGRISQSLTGGREKSVTVEVRKRRPSRG